MKGLLSGFVAVVFLVDLSGTSDHYNFFPNLPAVSVQHTYSYVLLKRLACRLASFEFPIAIVSRIRRRRQVAAIPRAIGVAEDIFPEDHPPTQVQRTVVNSFNEPAIYPYTIFIRIRQRRATSINNSLFIIIHVDYTESTNPTHPIL